MHIDAFQDYQYELRDFHFFYYPINRGQIAEPYSCKESAVYSLNSNDIHVFRYRKNLQPLIDAIHRIEESLKISKSKFVEIDGEHSYKIVEVQSKFWFNNKIYFDFFCSIWKTLRNKNDNQLKLIGGYQDIPVSNYFTTSGLLKKSLGIIKSLRKILDTSNHREDKEYLFNYHANGLCNALRNSYKINPEFKKRINKIN